MNNFFPMKFGRPHWFAWSMLLLAGLFAQSALAQKPPKQNPAEIYRSELEEPATRMIMESNPTTPRQLMRAVQLLVELGRAPLAHPLIKQLAEAKLDDAAMYELAEVHGSGTLLKLAAKPELAPEAGKLVDEILAAAERVRSDPARLAKAVKGLTDASLLVRQQAVIELARAHGAAVAPLLAVLADPQRKNEHQAAREMLGRLGQEAIPPLQGALDAPSEALQIQVIEVLGDLQVRQAAPELASRFVAPTTGEALRAAAGQALEKIVGAPPTKREAQEALAQEVRMQLRRANLLDSPSAAPVDVWSWDAKQQASVLRRVPPTEAALTVAARLASALQAIDPDDAANRRLYLTTILEAAKYRAGLDKPLDPKLNPAYTIASRLGADVINDLLAELVKSPERVAAATAAIEILGDIGSPDLVATGEGQPSPLVEAVKHSDRRVRFAAMDAILKLRPSAGFPGASHVSNSLAYFVGTSGIKRALVGHPRSLEALRIGGLLTALGYEVDTGTTARQVWDLATTRPDYEVALLHVSLRSPPVDEIVKQLRNEPCTAQLPIGLLGDADDIPRIERFTRVVPLCLALPEPQTSEAVKSQIDQLLGLLGRHFVAQPERQREAEIALTHLEELVAQRYTQFDLSRQLASVERPLQVPAFSARAMMIMSDLGTARGQRTLVEMADRMGQPLAVRQLAAVAFARSVEKHGILLTTGEITRQYDRYNLSAKQDAGTQQVLSSILDVLEGKYPAEK